MFRTQDYLDFAHTEHAALFEVDAPPWDALKKIESYLREHLPAGRHASAQVHASASVGEKVFLDEGVIVEAGANIKGPAWIGKRCVVRTGCYIRENVVTGAGCVLGNSCEFKNCLLFDNCEVPHFNYVGDTILGYKAHLGAGVILSNVRLDRQEVIIRDGSTRISTGLRKFSAVIGDHAEIGCNSVISPGTLIGRRSIVYPLASFAGVLPEGMILKVRQDQMLVARD